MNKKSKIRSKSAESPENYMSTRSKQKNINDKSKNTVSSSSSSVDNSSVLDTDDVELDFRIKKVNNVYISEVHSNKSRRCVKIELIKGVVKKERLINRNTEFICHIPKKRSGEVDVTLVVDVKKERAIHRDTDDGMKDGCSSVVDDVSRIPIENSTTQGINAISSLNSKISSEGLDKITCKSQRNGNRKHLTRTCKQCSVITSVKTKKNDKEKVGKLLTERNEKSSLKRSGIVTDEGSSSFECRKKTRYSLRNNQNKDDTPTINARNSTDEGNNGGSSSVGTANPGNSKISRIERENVTDEEDTSRRLAKKNDDSEDSSDINENERTSSNLKNALKEDDETMTVEGKSSVDSDKESPLLNAGTSRNKGIEKMNSRNKCSSAHLESNRSDDVEVTSTAEVVGNSNCVQNERASVVEQCAERRINKVKHPTIKELVDNFIFIVVIGEIKNHQFLRNLPRLRLPGGSFADRKVISLSVKNNRILVKAMQNNLCFCPKVYRSETRAKLNNPILVESNDCQGRVSTLPNEDDSNYEQMKEKEFEMYSIPIEDDVIYCVLFIKPIQTGNRERMLIQPPRTNQPAFIIAIVDEPIISNNLSDCSCAETAPIHRAAQSTSLQRTDRSKNSFKRPLDNDQTIKSNPLKKSPDKSVYKEPISDGNKLNPSSSRDLTSNQLCDSPANSSQDDNMPKKKPFANSSHQPFANHGSTSVLRYSGSFSSFKSFISEQLSKVTSSVGNSRSNSSVDGQSPANLSALSTTDDNSFNQNRSFQFSSPPKFNNPLVNAHLIRPFNFKNQPHNGSAEQSSTLEPSTSEGSLSDLNQSCSCQTSQQCNVHSSISTVRLARKIQQSSTNVSSNIRPSTSSDDNDNANRSLPNNPHRPAQQISQNLHSHQKEDSLPNQIPIDSSRNVHQLQSTSDRENSSRSITDPKLKLIQHQLRILESIINKRLAQRIQEMQSYLDRPSSSRNKSSISESNTSAGHIQTNLESISVHITSSLSDSTANDSSSTDMKNSNCKSKSTDVPKNDDKLINSNQYSRRVLGLTQGPNLYHFMTPDSKLKHPMSAICSCERYHSYVVKDNVLYIHILKPGESNPYPTCIPSQDD